MNINLDNYEEYLLCYVDGELEEAEVAALTRFLQNHPDKQRELELLRMTKAEPESDVVFGDKKSLYRREETTKIKKIPRRSYGWTVAAAAVLLLLITFFLHPWKPALHPDVLVVKKAQQAIKPPSQILPVPDTSATEIVVKQKTDTATLLAKNDVGEKKDIIKQTTPSAKNNPDIAKAPAHPVLHSLPAIKISPDLSMEEEVEPALIAQISRKEFRDNLVEEPLPARQTLTLSDKVINASEAMGAAKQNMDNTLTQKLSNLHQKTSGFIEHIAKKGIKIGNITFAVNN